MDDNLPALNTEYRSTIGAYSVEGASKPMRPIDIRVVGMTVDLTDDLEPGTRRLIIEAELLRIKGQIIIKTH